MYLNYSNLLRTSEPKETWHNSLSANFFGSLHECLDQFFSLLLHLGAPSRHVVDSLPGQGDHGAVARKLGPVGEKALDVSLQEPRCFL